MQLENYSTPIRPYNVQGELRDSGNRANKYTRFKYVEDRHSR
jgi:hypothetical protein